LTETSPILSAQTPPFLIGAAAERSGNDPIFALDAEARGRAAKGESILNTTLGALMEDDGRLAVLPSVLEAMRSVPGERAAGYAPIAGPREYIDAVIHDVYGSDPELESETLAVATPGATGAIHHAVMNFLEPGHELLVPSYYWGPYQTIALQTGRAVRTFRMFGEDGRFDLRAFEAGLAELIARQGRALIVFNFPCNNPTGYSLDDAEWSAVAEIVRRHATKAPIALLVDLAYAAFGGTGASDWVRHVRTMADPAIVLVAWTASKSMAQYGARVGALLATHPDPGVRERIGNALSFSCRGTWSNCNHLGMLAMTRLLTDPDLVRRVREDRARETDRLARRVAAFNAQARAAGLAHPRYEGGFFVAVFTPDGQRTAKAMRAEGVYVVPLSGPGVSAVRVALCATPEAEVPRLVESLARGTAAAHG